MAAPHALRGTRLLFGASTAGLVLLSTVATVALLTQGAQQLALPARVPSPPAVALPPAAPVVVARPPGLAHVVQPVPQPIAEPTAPSLPTPPTSTPVFVGPPVVPTVEPPVVPTVEPPVVPPVVPGLVPEVKRPRHPHHDAQQDPPEDHGKHLGELRHGRPLKA